MNHGERLDYLVSHASHDINLCAAACSVISEAPYAEQPQLLKRFLVGYDESISDRKMELPVFVRDDEKIHLMSCYGKMVDTFLLDLQKKSLPEMQFYCELWKYIQHSPKLDTNKARIFALYDVAIDKSIPYHYIDRRGMLSMENDEFRSINHDIGDEVFEMLEHILVAPFDQRTQQASLIVKMLDSYSDYKYKTVFLTHLIGFFEKKIIDMQLARLIHDDD